MTRTAIAIAVRNNTTNVREVLYLHPTTSEPEHHCMELLRAKPLVQFGAGRGWSKELFNHPSTCYYLSVGISFLHASTPALRQQRHACFHSSFPGSYVLLFLLALNQGKNHSSQDKTMNKNTDAQNNLLSHTAITLRPTSASPSEHAPSTL